MSTIAQRLLNLYNNMVIANSVTNEFVEALPDCYDAVEAKGGTIPAQPTVANLPDAIESIPQSTLASVYLYDPPSFSNLTQSAFGEENIVYVGRFLFDAKLQRCPNVTKINLSRVTFGQLGGTYMRFWCYNCPELVSLDLRFDANFDIPYTGNSSNWFYGVPKLKDIRVGSWAKYSINIEPAGAMTRDSIVQLLTDLPTPADSSQVITMGAAKLALLTNEDKAIATSKGWTLA